MNPQNRRQVSIALSLGAALALCAFTLTPWATALQRTAESEMSRRMPISVKVEQLAVVLDRLNCQARRWKQVEAELSVESDFLSREVERLEGARGSGADRPPVMSSAHGEGITQRRTLLSTVEDAALAARRKSEVLAGEVNALTAQLLGLRLRLKISSVTGDSTGEDSTYELLRDARMLAENADHDLARFEATQRARQSE